MVVSQPGFGGQHSPDYPKMELIKLKVFLIVTYLLVGHLK
jgi:hypothetical protein